MLKQAYSNISRIQPCHQHTLRQEGGCTRITASALATTWFFMSSSTTLWKSADCYIRDEILSRLSGRFLSAKERRKFDTGLLTLLDVVDADPAQKLYRYRKVPVAARAPTAAYELYREFRTNRRPLNVASVVSRTVRAGKFIYGGRRPPRPRGASLKQKLSFAKVRGHWRFIPRNSKKVENSLQICVDFR